MARLAHRLLVLVLGSVLVAAGFAASRAQAATSTTLFGTKTPTASERSIADPKAITVGVVFKSSQAGTIDGVRFYKGAGNTGTHIGALWTAGGTLLAQATFTGETSTGWQSVAFAVPVPITAGTLYRAGAYLPAGHYAQTKGAFDRKSITSGPLTAPASVSGNANGRFTYGAGLRFPVDDFATANYWVDVTFSTGTGPPPTTTTSAPTTTTSTTGAPPTTTTTVPPTTTTTTAPPPPTGKPDGTNTGVPDGVTLRVLDGTSEDHGCWAWTGYYLNINGADCVVDGVYVPGEVKVYGARATIRNSRMFNVIGGSYPGNTGKFMTVAVNWTWNGASLTLEDSEVAGSEYCIAGYSFTILRSEMTGCAHEVQATGPGITILNSWLHGSVGTADAHTDVIQSVRAGGIVLRGNTWELGSPPGAFATISLMDDSGCGNVIDGNWIHGQGWWLIGVQTASGCSTQVTNNRLGRDVAGGSCYCVTPVVQSGNVWDDTGEPVTI